MNELLEIFGASHRLVIGQLVGGPDAPLNRSTTNLANTTTAAATKAREVRGATNLLESERVGRLDLLAKEPKTAFQSHKALVARETKRINDLARTANPFAKAETLPLHVLLEDQALATRFAAMDIAARVQILSKAAVNPGEYQRWAEMLLRVNPALTDAPAAQLETLRQACLEHFSPQVARSIETQQQMLELAQRAQELAMEALGEALPTIKAELAAMPATDAVLDAALSGGGTAMTEAQRWAAWHAMDPQVKEDLMRGMTAEQRVALLTKNVEAS